MVRSLQPAPFFQAAAGYTVTIRATDRGSPDQLSSDPDFALTVLITATY